MVQTRNQSAGLSAFNVKGIHNSSGLQFEKKKKHETIKNVMKLFCVLKYIVVYPSYDINEIYQFYNVELPFSPHPVQ